MEQKQLHKQNIGLVISNTYLPKKTKLVSLFDNTFNTDDVIDMYCNNTEIKSIHNNVLIEEVLKSKKYYKENIKRIKIRCSDNKFFNQEFSVILNDNEILKYKVDTYIESINTGYINCDFNLNEISSIRFNLNALSKVYLYFEYYEERSSLIKEYNEEKDTDSNRIPNYIFSLGAACGLGSKKGVLFGYHNYYNKPNYGSDYGVYINTNNSLFDYSFILSESAFKPFKIKRIIIMSEDLYFLNSVISLVSISGTRQMVSLPINLSLIDDSENNPFVKTFETFIEIDGGTHLELSVSDKHPAHIYIFKQ